MIVRGLWKNKKNFVFSAYTIQLRRKPKKLIVIVILRFCCKNMVLGATFRKKTLKISAPFIRVELLLLILIPMEV